MNLLRYILIPVLVVLLMFSAFFSAAETAYTAVNPARIEAAAHKKQRIGLLIKKHINSFGWILATILLGNNLVNVALSTLTSLLLSSFFASNGALPTVISIVLITPTIVIFGEIIPKLFAKRYSYGYLKKIVYTMEVLKYLFLPFTYFLSKVVLKSEVTHTENEIKSLINLASSEGVLEKKEATLVKNALDLDSTIVGKVMHPIKKAKTVKSSSSLAKCINVFRLTGHSRLIIEKNGAQLGILHIKDVLGEPGDALAINYLKRVPNISRNVILTNALEILRRESVHFAFVTPTMERNKIVGMITLEDILEELVGEIYDEHDHQLAIYEIGLHKYIVNGTVKATTVAQKLHLKLAITDQEITIQKWLSQRLKRRIKNHLQYVYKGKIRFKVISNRKGEAVKLEITQI